MTNYNDIVRIIKGILLIIITFLLVCFLGYVGAKIALENNFNIYQGVACGVLFPFGIVLVKQIVIDIMQLNAIEVFICYIVYFFITYLIFSYLPSWFSVILLILFLYIIIFGIISNYLIVPKEEKTIDNNENSKKSNKKNDIKVYNEKKYTSIRDKQEEYYCERCNKAITYEEYELNDYLCEDCYVDVHTDENGNYDDDYFNY